MSPTAHETDSKPNSPTMIDFKRNREIRAYRRGDERRIKQRHIKELIEDKIKAELNQSS